jgi:pyruvate kinase
MMAKIAERAEAAIDYKKNFFHYERAANQNVTDAVCHAACTTAIDLNAAAVIIVTKSGVSARNISKYRPSCNIIAGTTSDKAYRQLNMSWGVTPVHLEEQNEVFTLFDHAVAAGKKQGLLQPGDKVVIGAGVPLGISGNTNMLKVQVVE